jgi:cytochrome c5
MMHTPDFSRIFSALSLVALLCSATVASADGDSPVERKRYTPNIELPQSEGREVILRACTMCHELGGLAGYKGYWGLEQWKALVAGMVKNGAVLTPAEQETVAAYLTRHFGPDALNK